VEITEIRIFPRSESKVKAFAQITFDNSFVVRNLRVIEGRERLFVAMPSRKKRDGTHEDVAHPITNELRKKIETMVIEEYHRVKETDQYPPAETPSPSVVSGEPAPEEHIPEEHIQEEPQQQ